MAVALNLVQLTIVEYVEEECQGRLKVDKDYGPWDDGDVDNIVELELTNPDKLNLAGCITIYPSTTERKVSDTVRMGITHNKFKSDGSDYLVWKADAEIADPALFEAIAKLIALMTDAETY